MDEIFADVGTADLTLSEVLRLVDRLQSEHPDYEVFLDGDRLAIMGRPLARGASGRCRRRAPAG